MNVVYFAVGEEHAAMAELAAEALRLFHPDWPAWVLTDEKTQFKTLRPVRGYTSPMTLIYDRAILQRQFLLEHDAAETLFLDSDCIVNRSLDKFMEGPVGVTWRDPPKQAAGMFINGGVIYACGKMAQPIWSHFVDLFAFIQRDAWSWYGDQILLGEVHKEYSTFFKIYPCETHNYSWSSAAELQFILPAYIVHFKGARRKEFLPQYVDRLKAQYGTQDLRRSA